MRLRKNCDMRIRKSPRFVQRRARVRVRKLVANGGVVGPSGMGVMVRLGGDSLRRRCEVVGEPELLAEDRSRTSLSVVGGGGGDIDAIAADKLYICTLEPDDTGIPYNLVIWIYLQLYRVE